MRVLVAGGTGFIGSHIVQELVKTCPGVEVQILTRRARPQDSRASYVAGDVTDPSSLPNVARDMDVVIHCVQFPNHPVENPTKGWTYERVDAQGTQNLVRACTQAGVRRFVYLSGVGVGPGRTQPWFRAKHAAEEAVHRSGMDYAILRPSWVYGPEDRSLNKFVFFTRYFPVVPVIGAGTGKVQPLSVFDVAKVASLCANRTGVLNKTLELGGPQALSMNEILRILQRVLHKRRLLVHSPVPFVKLAARFLTLLPNPPLSPSAIDFALMEELIDPRPAEQYFGLKFEDLETGLRRYL